MLQHAFTGLILLTLCTASVGCSEEPTGPTPSNATTIKPEADQAFAMVLETSQPTLWRNGEAIDAIEYVGQLATMPSKVDREYTIRIDESFKRDLQLRLLLGPTFEQDKNAVDLPAAADQLFIQLKEGFDRLAEEGLAEELADQQAQAVSAAASVKEAQQVLQAFYGARRGLPQTDASRLEQRKLERQIEKALQAQIDADKYVTSLQKKIKRSQHAKLLRVQ